EQQARVGQLTELVSEVGLELFGEEAAAQDVPVPKAAIFDEDPVVDPAGCRSERLLASVRDFGTKGLADGHGHE
ncbi:MAG: hypothetical protein WD805_04970, partial [Gaiellaceae bacterium]